MNHSSMKIHSTVFLLLFFLAGPAYSLELSLESNKAESGTVGYVDIDLVFKKYSLTKLQKDTFKDKIKEKEDFLNAKKKILFALKAEISQLKQEREFAKLREPQSHTASCSPAQTDQTQSESRSQRLQDEQAYKPRQCG